MNPPSGLSQPLTQYSPGGGCACKLPQALLDEVLTVVRSEGLGSGAHEELRAGLASADDAAVYDLDDTRSLLMTCDFLTPLVDDGYEWGRIAATNALSDVYAMGGRPLLALNLLAWPADLDQQTLGEVLRGGARAVADAGALLVGGHSIVDPTPKFGLAVVGDVDRHALLRKGGGRAGDVLVLTKPLGLGVVSTAVKRGQASSGLVEMATTSMTRLNAEAAAVARDFGLSGGTDVTGYGLAGHLHEMASASGVAAHINTEQVPLLPDVSSLVEAGCAPGGSTRTLANALDSGWFDPGNTDPVTQLLLADAQTSGGLLLAVADEDADGVVAQLRARGDDAAAVGALVDGEPGTVSAR